MERKKIMWAFIIASIQAIFIIGYIYYISREKSEYKIELLNQKEVYIQSETQADTIQLDSVIEWIERDNL